VLACVAAVAVLSALDLALTLRRMLGPGMLELNPLAVWIARETGPAGLALFKLGLTALSCAVLAALRARRSAEVASLVAVAILSCLCMHWARFERVASGMPRDCWILTHGRDPAFIRFPPPGEPMRTDSEPLR
jgi:hypothetical protein